MALDKYKIKKVDYNTAMNIVVKNHYLHRKCPCSIAFGLFLNDDIKGVICYGSTGSAALSKGIAGEENSCNVIELNRLWLCDTVPKNGESFLIGNTIKNCGKEIVVSYADISQGHTGVVYQATNWIYTGLSAKRTDWAIEGIDKHCKTISNKYTSKELREKFGDRFSLKDRTRKHRYVFINAKGKRRKKELIDSLKYKILPYPKN